MAEILASLVYLLVYVSTYCVPIALLRQNKPFPLLYLGHAQIINQGSTKIIIFDLGEDCTQSFIYYSGYHQSVSQSLYTKPCCINNNKKNGSDLPQHHKCLHSQNDQWHNLKTVSWHCWDAGWLVYSNRLNGQAAERENVKYCFQRKKLTEHKNKLNGHHAKIKNKTQHDYNNKIISY